MEIMLLFLLTVKQLRYKNKHFATALATSNVVNFSVRNLHFNLESLKPTIR